MPKSKLPSIMWPIISIEPVWKEWDEDGEHYAFWFYRVTCKQQGHLKKSKEFDRLKYALEYIDTLLKDYKD